MNNPQIAKNFEEIADLLEILNENPFRVRSYRKAAMTIQSLPHEVRDLDESKLTEIPGIGKDLAEKIKEFLTTGKMRLHEELLAKVPKGILEIVQIPGVGPKTAKRLWDELHITTLEQLEKAAREHKIQKLKGLGEKIEEKILKGIELKRKYKERHGIGKTLPLAQEIVEWLQKKAPLIRIEIAGSLRRMQETIADIDILVASKKSEDVMKVFVGLPFVEEVLAHGETKSSILTKQGIQCDLRVVEEKSFGAALHYFTGSKAHNIRVRQLGQERGLKINEYGIFKGEKQIGGKTEEEIFEVLGLPFIPPELREDRGEIEAGLAGKLPHLITLQDIRGDCHMHTNWSDGAHPLSVMVEAARKRYDYAAISDHSRMVGVTGGMDAPTLLKQVEELRRLAKQYDDFTLLRGIEVDIKPDGTLDMPDEVLAQLDVVLASVHIKFNMTEEEMTARIIKAMENPYVTVIAHPTGRLIGAREPYPVNMEKLLDAAKRTGTFMELDSFWDRLDLNDIYLRMAKEKGVKIMIDTDAHNISHFEMLRFGVAQARRGWLEPHDVVNTLPVEKFLQAIKAKRTKMLMG
jgi:DNA polymerase (family 10)